MLKVPCFEFFGDGKCSLFWVKALMEIWHLLLTKKSFFELFGNGKYGLFLRKKADGKTIFTGYWKVLVLNFLVMENTVFFRQKVNRKMIFTCYWKVLVLGHQIVFVLNFSVMGNTVFFFSLKIGVKIIFNWYFYGSSCSGSINW